MKVLAASLFVFALVTVSSAQQYAIDWFTMGGGGTSTGGVFSVNGNIGQPDAGAMTGGQYALTGSFWEVSAIQTPGAPLLSVANSNGIVVVFWPRPAEGFLLDQTMALASPGPISWSQVSAATYQTNATHIFITIPTLSGTKFYRLRK